ncbi:MAG: amidohydrolase family protein [Flammeovirgaceae bacterium]
MWAQEGLKPVTRTFAIRNANIIPAPGKKIEKGSILIKNGLIAAVGKDIKIPTNAHIIEADSMFVYAGFIDGFSQMGVKEEKKEGDTGKPKNPGNPSNEQAGVQPEVSVSNLLDNKNANLETMRKLGFTTAHVFPKGRFLAGKGALILTAAESSDKLIVKNESSMCVQFIGANNVYPANQLGMMAKYKQLYREASFLKKHEEIFAQNGNGINRPERNRTLEAFYPVIDKKVPVFFKADNLLDAQKALELQKELGFPLVLAELKEGWLLIDKLKASKAGVFLSLSLPEEEKKDTTSVKKDSVSIKPKSLAEQEMERLKKRKEESVLRYISQASTLNKAGIKFGFSTLGAKTGDLRKNFKKMMDKGLSEEALLAALTTHPAELLGVSNIMGTLETGKMANLFVASAPFYDEKCNVKYVFVDGVLYEYKENTNTKKDPNAKVNPLGTWKYVTDSPQGKNEGKIIIKGKEGSYTGTMSFSFNGQTSDISDIKLDGNELTFTVSISTPDGSFPLKVSATINGDSISGTLDTGRFGNLPLTGNKEPE